MRTALPFFAALVLLLALPACGLTVFGSVDPNADDAGVASRSSVSDAGQTSTDAPLSTGSAPDLMPSPDASAPDSNSPKPGYVPSSGAPSFSDTFARPNASDPGNAWLDKTPGGLAITSEHVASTAAGPSVFALRPVSEKELDVEVSGTFTLTSGLDEASLVARASDDSEAAGTFHGYRFRVQSTQAEILFESITPASSMAAPWVTTDILQALVVGHPYRAFLRVTGTSPVHLEGGIFEVGGATSLVWFQGDDSGPYRAIDPGRVGFAASESGTTWDDFERRDLP